MTAQWRSAYDRDGRAVVYAGETVEARLVLEQPDGAGGWEPQDLTGRVFVQRIIYANGTVLASVTGVNTIEDGEAIVTFTISGAATADLLPDEASEALLQHEVSEVLVSGRDVLIEQAFTVLRGAGNAGLPSSTTPPNAARFAMRDRMIVRYMGARGPKGDAGPGVAEDVSYDDAFTALGVDNVQDALNAIYEQYIVPQSDFSKPSNSGLGLLLGVF